MSSIHINGEAISITVSLWHALAAIRSTDQAILTWADALSINQHDVDELNYQVQIMDTIYSKAETVAICLGPHSEDGTSRLALPYLREILSPSCPSKIDCIESKEQISAVVHLFERSYWKRLWIMQEVFHAKKAVVYCGSDSIALGEMSLACKYFELNTLRIENGFPSGKGAQKSTNHYSFAQTLTTQGPNALLDPSTDLVSTPLHILRLCRNKLAARLVTCSRHAVTCCNAPFTSSTV
ncbi:hypothetical protein CCHR01_11996 [Colletotrichum chrysophilum]|uniref:Heterokaryon incompatibility domain-containing protein n=1 Tax=Colletotrichum chrysophilum TaxID=1836956 RepID=A0AAD9ACS6_9PEZI|nr:hypothetical protein CCHR01_11996 [Colletotrichum chrysophilum]